jgi:hypothetical protein
MALTKNQVTPVTNLVQFLDKEKFAVPKTVQTVLTPQFEDEFFASKQTLGLSESPNPMEFIQRPTHPLISKAGHTVIHDFFDSVELAPPAKVENSWEEELDKLRRKVDNDAIYHNWQNRIFDAQYQYHNDLFEELESRIDESFDSATSFLTSIGFKTHKGFIFYLFYRILELINTENEFNEFMQTPKSLRKAFTLYRKTKTPENSRRLTLKYDIMQEIFALSHEKVFPKLSKQKYKFLREDALIMRTFTDFRNQVGTFCKNHEVTSKANQSIDKSIFIFLKIMALEKLQKDNKNIWKNESLLRTFQSLQRFEDPKEMFIFVREIYNKTLYENNLSIKESKDFWKKYRDSNQLSKDLEGVTSIFVPRNYPKEFLRGIMTKPFPEKSLL